MGKKHYFFDILQYKESTCFCEEIKDFSRTYPDDNHIQMVVSEKSRDEKGVKKLINQIIRITTYIDDNLLDMEENAIIFNEQYGTYDNQYFQKQSSFFKKVETIFGMLTKLLVRMSPSISKSKQQYLESMNKKLNPLYYSYLTCTNVQTFLFTDTNPACVAELQSSIQSLGDALQKCLEIIMDTISKEERIKNDRDESLLRFNAHLGAFEKHSLHMLDFRINDTDPAVIEFKNVNCDEKEFGSCHFHVYNLLQVQNLFAFILNYRKQKMNATDGEYKVFGGDADSLNLFRYMTAHFDELIPEKNRKNKKIHADYIYAIIQKYIPNFNNQLALTNAYICFKDSYQGQYQLPGYTAIHNSRNKPLKSNSQTDADKITDVRNRTDMPSFMKKMETQEHLYQSLNNKTLEINALQSFEVI